MSDLPKIEFVDLDHEPFNTDNLLLNVEDMEVGKVRIIPPTHAEHFKVIKYQTYHYGEKTGRVFRIKHLTGGQYSGSLQILRLPDNTRRHTRSPSAPSAERQEEVQTEEVQVVPQQQPIVAEAPPAPVLSARRGRRPTLGWTDKVRGLGVGDKVRVEASKTQVYNNVAQISKRTKAKFRTGKITPTLFVVERLA